MLRLIGRVTIRMVIVNWFLLVIASFMGSQGSWEIANFDSYRNRNDEVYILDIKSGLAVNLSRSPKPDFDLSLSPDNRWFAFVSPIDKNLFVYLGDVLTGETNLIYQTDEPISHYVFKWSPDSKYLEFVDRQIHIASTTNHTINDIDGYNPLWSPDAKWLAFLTNVQGGQGKLSLINFETSKRITLYQDHVSGAFSWSSNSQKLAFITDSGSIRRGNELYILEVAAERVTFVAQRVNIDYSANNIWSPDDQNIVFNGYDASNQLQIFLADPNVPNPPLSVISDSPAPNDNPIWSPDGQFIVYTSLGTQTEVYVYELSNKHLMKLPEFNYSYISVLGWNPDNSQFLLFMWSALRNSAEFQVFDITTGTAKQIGLFTFFDMQYPLGTRNTRFVSFKYWQNNAEEIYVANLDTMTLTNVNSRANVPPPTPVYVTVD